MKGTVGNNENDIKKLRAILAEICLFYGEEDYDKQIHELVFTSIAAFIQDVQVAKGQIAVRQAEAKQKRLLEERRNSTAGLKAAPKSSPKHGRSRSLLGNAIGQDGQGGHHYGLVDDIMARLRREIVEVGKAKQMQV